MTASCVAITAARLASIASSQSAKKLSGSSATPSRDNNSYTTIFRTPCTSGARRTWRLARHAVVNVDDSRAEGAGPGEFKIRPPLVLGEERNATAHQHRVDPGPVLANQAQRGRLGGESRAADRDVALRRLGPQSPDLLRQAAGGQAGVALHRRQRGREHHLGERLPERGPLEH